MADDKAATNRCPICKKETVEAFRPFCSKRCANVDLFKWLKGEYALPSEEGPFDEEFGPFDELSQSTTPH